MRVYSAVIVLLATATLAALPGCFSGRGDADRLAAVQEAHRLEQSEPETTVWVRNRSGTPVTHVSFEYRLGETTAPGSDATYSADGQFSRDRERIGEPAEQVWGKGWPGWITFRSVRVKVGGMATDHSAGYESRPGERVLIEVGKDGKVTIGPWTDT
jgi:hypothetical protein